MHLENGLLLLEGVLLLGEKSQLGVLVFLDFGLLRAQRLEFRARDLKLSFNKTKKY